MNWSPVTAGVLTGTLSYAGLQAAGRGRGALKWAVLIGGLAGLARAAEQSDNRRDRESADG